MALRNNGIASTVYILLCISWATPTFRDTRCQDPLPAREVKISPVIYVQLCVSYQHPDSKLLHSNHTGHCSPAVPPKIIFPDNSGQAKLN